MTFFLFLWSDEAAGGDAAHVEQLPPKVGHPQVEEPPKADEEMSAGALIEELSVAAARQATLVAQLKA